MGYPTRIILLHLNFIDNDRVPPRFDGKEPPRLSAHSHSSRGRRPMNYRYAKATEIVRGRVGWGKGETVEEESSGSGINFAGNAHIRISKGTFGLSAVTSVPSYLANNFSPRAVEPRMERASLARSLSHSFHPSPCASPTGNSGPAGSRHFAALPPSLARGFFTALSAAMPGRRSARGPGRIYPTDKNVSRSLYRKSGEDFNKTPLDCKVQIERARGRKKEG